MVVYLLVLLLCKHFITLKSKKCLNLPQKERQIMELEDPVYTCNAPPTIIVQSLEDPPEYWDLESARASPLPSYETVMYCDQLNRSFNSLLSSG